MKLWKQFKSVSVERHSVRPKCQVRLQLTGEPPGNPSEYLIKEIVGESKSVPLGWLEERVGDRLYRAELGRGGWAVDIGLWGPTVFAKETARIVAEVRPQFAFLVRESEAGHAVSDKNRPAGEAQEESKEVEGKLQEAGRVFENGDSVSHGGGRCGHSYGGNRQKSSCPNNQKRVMEWR